MKSSWKRIRLGDVCEVIPGFAFKSDDFGENGIPVVKIKNITGDRRIDLSDGDMLPQELVTEKMGKFVLGDGDILLAMTGATAGKVGKLRTKSPVLLNQRVAKIKPIRANPNFIWSVVSSDEYQDRFYKLADGAAQPNMSGSQIENVELLLPPDDEQLQIGAILSAYDDLIENNTRRIKILEEMAQTIYREWFVEFRAPGVELRKATPEEQKLTGKDVFPKGWEISALNMIAEVNSLSIQRNKNPEMIAYIDIASVGTGVVNNIETLDFSNSPSRARRIVRHGDIIWSTVRPNRKSYSLILNPQLNLIVSTGFAVISATTVPFTYLYHATTTNEFVGYLTNHATGAAYPAVGASDFENAKVILASTDILHKFHERVEPLYLLKHSLQTKNTNLRRTRDLLLPKLISGEVVVESAEIISD